MKEEEFSKTHFHILLVDTDSAYLESCKKILKKEGHHIAVAKNTQEAVRTLRKSRFDLLIMAYFMHGKAVDHALFDIRKFEHRVRILLVSDQKQYADGRDLIHRLPIQGYFEKQEGSEKLLIWVDMILKSLPKLDALHSKVADIQNQARVVHKNREGLRQIIHSMPEVVQTLQSMDKFVEGVLIQLNSFIETENSFLATLDENNKLRLLAGTGVFFERKSDFLRHPFFLKRKQRIEKTLATGENLYDETFSIFPLKIRDRVIGIFYVDKGEAQLTHLTLEMLQLFSSQVAITIENARLFHQASVDSLTQLYARRYFLERFQEILRLLSRVGNQAISLLIVDLDHFKPINDQFGHLEGDKILVKIGKIIRDSVRATDVAGRLGGEEFGILLINTSPKKGQEIAEALRKKVEEETFMIQRKAHRITVSIGIGSFEAYRLEPALSKGTHASQAYLEDQRRLLRSADEALYEAKNAGRNRVCVSPSLPPLEKLADME
jgi:diguanylate cyclase (GGDEF)-like protein